LQDADIAVCRAGEKNHREHHAAELVLGWFWQAAIQAPAAHRLGFRYRPARFFGDVYIRRALKLALPILVCSWLQPVCNVINTRYASGFEGGSGITMVSYANRPAP